MRITGRDLWLRKVLRSKLLCGLNNQTAMLEGCHVMDATLKREIPLVLKFCQLPVSFIIRNWIGLSISSILSILLLVILIILIMRDGLVESLALLIPSVGCRLPAILSEQRCAKMLLVPMLRWPHSLMVIIWTTWTDRKSRLKSHGHGAVLSVESITFGGTSTTITLERAGYGLRLHLPATASSRAQTLSHLLDFEIFIDNSI